MTTRVASPAAKETATLRDGLGLAVLCSGLFLLALLVSHVVRTEIQLRLLPDHFLSLNLFYLPHGVSVVAAWMFRWRAVPYLLPATLIMMLLTGTGGMPALTWLAISLFILISAPLTFRGLQAFGIDVFRNRDLALNWRVLVFVGLLSSVLNGVVVHALAFSVIPSAEHLTGLGKQVLGDMTGLAAVLLILLFGFRWMDLYRKLPARSDRS